MRMGIRHSRQLLPKIRKTRLTLDKREVCNSVYITVNFVKMAKSCSCREKILLIIFHTMAHIARIVPFAATENPGLSQFSKLSILLGYRRFSASSSSSVRGQSCFNNRDSPAIREQLSARLAPRTIIRLVVGVANPLDLLPAPRTRLPELSMHRHLLAKRRHLLRKPIAGLRAQPVDPQLQRLPASPETAAPTPHRSADASASPAKAAPHAESHPNTHSQSRSPAADRSAPASASDSPPSAPPETPPDRTPSRRSRPDPPSCSASSPARTYSDARRFEPASVSTSDPGVKSNAASAFRPASFAPADFQCSRPAIIRCRTSQRSPSTPIAIRFPMRRSSRTTRPFTLSSGGSTVRKSVKLASRTCSSFCPRMRVSSALR